MDQGSQASIFKEQQRLRLCRAEEPVFIRGEASSYRRVTPAIGKSRQHIWIPEVSKINRSRRGQILRPRAPRSRAADAISDLRAGELLQKERAAHTGARRRVVCSFGKSFLISIVNVFGVIDWNLPIFKYNLTWYLFATFTVASTVLWGRFYCGRICAFGALTQLMDAVLPAKLRYDVPLRIERRAAWIKYGLLASVVAYFIVTRQISVYRYVEPFWMFGLAESTGMWVALATLLLAASSCATSIAVPVSGRCGAGHHLEPNRLRINDGPCSTCRLREDLPVGRHPGAEDHQVGMRPLRRLRAPLPRQQKCRTGSSRRRGQSPLVAPELQTLNPETSKADLKVRTTEASSAG